MPIITLTTDFGHKDWFVGTMKGVILGLNPRARIVDLTHDVPGGDIRAGAFALAAGCRFFPKGSIHVAVVDPGVGSARKAVAMQTADYVFIGPDNGVLSLALASEKIKTIHSLENEAFFLQPPSRTFHGRDIFAPVGAHLSRGVPIRRFGPRLKDLVRLGWPKARRQGGSIQGEVIYIDRFGNAISNIGNELLSGLSEAVCNVVGNVRWTCPLRDSYAAVPAGRPVAVPGSTGFLEIAVNGGSAANTLGLKIGSRLLIRPTS